MSPKNIHLIFALLSCLWISCGNINAKNDIPESVFKAVDLRFHDTPSSLIKGIPKKIIIENVPSDADVVGISWPRPAVQGTVSQWNSYSQSGNLFYVGQPTKIVCQLGKSCEKNKINHFILKPIQPNGDLG